MRTYLQMTTYLLKLTKKYLKQNLNTCAMYTINLKVTLSGLRQFLATKNAFYFILKAVFVLKIFKFLS